MYLSVGFILIFIFLNNIVTVYNIINQKMFISFLNIKISNKKVKIKRLKQTITLKLKIS